MAHERSGESEEAGTVRCPGCGREYDARLFAFGRTRHCTCGARVGPEPPATGPDPGPDPRFFADAMLGNLARWLRILGFDTAYQSSILDPELVRRSLAEGRHILTRDRGLREEWRVSHCVVLESDDVELQLEEVFRRFGLEDEIRLFTRCALCNSVLESLDWEEARDRVREAEGLMVWGWTLGAQGDWDAARQQFEQALALARESGVRRVEADSLTGLGWCRS